MQRCIEKFHTYKNFEQFLNQGTPLADETIVILEPYVDPEESGLWAPGDGIITYNPDGSVKEAVTDKDPRATTIKHIKEALRAVDENSK